jgi:hypothetical protein
VLSLFVGVPVLLFVVIALLVYAPTVARGPRYRPGLGWWHGPVWFEGPPAGSDASRREADEATLAGGGASARW